MEYPRVIHGLGAERTFVPTVLWLDLCGGATGRVETTWEIGGPGPGRRPRLFHNNTFNEILVFDLSLATGLYALTNYAGKIWALDVVVSTEAFVMSATEWRAPDWTVSLLLY